MKGFAYVQTQVGCCICAKLNMLLHNLDVVPQSKTTEFGRCRRNQLSTINKVALRLFDVYLQLLLDKSRHVLITSDGHHA